MSLDDVTPWLGAVSVVLGIVVTAWNVIERRLSEVRQPARYVVGRLRGGTAPEEPTVVISNGGPEPVVIKHVAVSYGPMLPAWDNSWQAYMRSLRWRAQMDGDQLTLGAGEECELGVMWEKDQLDRGEDGVLIHKRVSAVHTKSGLEIPGTSWVWGPAVEVVFEDFNGRQWARCGHVIVRCVDGDLFSLRVRRHVWIERRLPAIFEFVSGPVASFAARRVTHGNRRWRGGLAYAVDWLVGWRAGKSETPFPANVPSVWHFNDVLSPTAEMSQIAAAAEEEDEARDSRVEASPEVLPPLSAEAFDQGEDQGPGQLREPRQAAPDRQQG